MTDNPTFQHRHYKEIAGMLAELGPVISRDELIDKLSRYFRQDNWRFSRDRFEAACNGKPLTKKDAA